MRAEQYMTRLFLVTGTAMVFVVLGLWQLLRLWIPVTGIDEHVMSLFLPIPAKQLAPEPIESSLYLLGILLVPLLLFLSVIVLTRGVGKQQQWGRDAAEVIRSLVIATLLFSPLFCSLAVQSVIAKAGFGHNQSILHILSAIIIASFIVVLECLACSYRCAHSSRLRVLMKRLIVVAGALTVVFTILSFRVFSFAHLSGSSVWFDHLDAVVSAIASVRHGNTLLVDSYSQYGLFPELLSPVLALLPPGVFGVTLVFAALQLMALLCLLRFLCCRINNPVVLLVGTAALLMVTFVLHTRFGLRYSEPDPVFQYWPIRFIGPALSVPIVMWAFRHLNFKRLLLLAAWTGLCLFWNLDSGIAVFYGMTLLVVTLAGLSFVYRDLWPKKRRMLAVSVFAVPVSWPLIILLALLVDCHLLALRKHLLPAASAPLAIAGLGTLLLPALGLSLCYPDLVKSALESHVHRPDSSQPPAPYLKSELSMIRKYCNDPGRPCLLITRRQGIYTLESPSQTFVAGFSPAEMLLRSDKDKLNRQLRSSANQRIFLGVGPSAVRHLWPLPELESGYRPVAINREHTLVMLDPKRTVKSDRFSLRFDNATIFIVSSAPAQSR